MSSGNVVIPYYVPSCIALKIYLMGSKLVGFLNSKDVASESVSFVAHDSPPYYVCQNVK